MAIDELELLEPSGGNESNSQIDIQKFIKGVWKRKWMILLLSVFMAIPFYFRAKNQVPIYKSKVVIQSKQIEDDQESFFNDEVQAEIRSLSFTEHMAKILGLAFANSDTQYTSIDQVFSEFYTTEDPVVTRYKIEIDDVGNYFLYQKENTREKVLVDSANVWDAVETPRELNGISFRLQPDFVFQPTEFHFRVRPFEKGVRFLQYGVNIAFNRSETFMVMELKDENPDYVYKELNRIAASYLEEMQKLKSRDSDTYRQMLEKRLVAAEDNVEKIDESLRRFYSQYPMSLELEKRELVDELKNNEQMLERLPEQRRQLTNLLTRLQSNNDEEFGVKYRSFVVREIANFPAMATEPDLAIHRQNLQELETRYNKLYETLPEDNEQVMELSQRIYETQEEIIEFAANYRNQMAERESELRREKVALENKLKALPNDEHRLMELERNKQVSEELYKFLYAEMQKLQVTEASQESGIRILDDAKRPAKPINPSQKTQVIFGAGLGLLLGLLISVGIDVGDFSLRTLKDVEQALNLKVIGTIPVISFNDIPDYRDDQKAKQIDKQLVTHDYSPTLVGEAYRSLRTHLLFSKDTEQIQSLLITSVGPEEGKSFTASNLAIILAQQHTNTLLVDADLRRGVQHNTFSVRKEPGLTNYLSSRSTLSGIVQPTHIPNLSVVSCGSLIPNPSEQLGSLKMKRFLAEVRRKFDFIIFDAPPLDAATDSVVLGTLVDAVSLVVRAGKTNRKTAKERLEIFETVPTNLIGVIMNGTEEALLKNSYSYYHY